MQFIVIRELALASMPDYEKYRNYKGVTFIPIDEFNTSYRDILPGSEAYDYNQLIMGRLNHCQL